MKLVTEKHTIKSNSKLAKKQSPNYAPEDIENNKTMEYAHFFYNLDDSGYVLLTKLSNHQSNLTPSWQRSNLLILIQWILTKGMTWETATGNLLM